jgi:hypothetical protein
MYGFPLTIYFLSGWLKAAQLRGELVEAAEVAF